MLAPGLVIFDCDGVLVDSEHLVQRVEMSLIAELGWPITVEEMTAEHLGRSWPTIQANIEAHVGHPLPPDFRARAVAETHAVFEAELAAVAGVATAIDSLTEASWATCVASSGAHERIRFTLGLVGLFSTFEGRIFSAEDVPRGKPAPDLFLHAASASGFGPLDCLVIEDSPAGIEAARAAGMKVVGYAGRTPAPLLGDADLVIDRMVDLPSAVDALN